MSIFCFFCFRHSRHCFAILVLATSDTIMGEMFLIVFISNTLLLPGSLRGGNVFSLSFRFTYFVKSRI